MVRSIYEARDPEVLELLRGGLSLRAVAREMKVDRDVIQRARDRLVRHGVSLRNQYVATKRRLVTTFTAREIAEHGWAHLEMEERLVHKIPEWAKAKRERGCLVFDWIDTERVESAA